MVFLQNIWWYLVLIGVMILIHELGHYWAARFFDVKVETFSFGFGPRLFGFRRGETDFRFSAILFGGYVKMAGEQPGEDATSDPRNFQAKPRWQRMCIAFAGPAINVVLAVVLLTGLFMAQYPKIPTPPNPVVGYVVPEAAAAKAGIHEGDQVVQIDDISAPNWEDIVLKEISNAGRSIPVWVKRGGETVKLNVEPVLDEKLGVGFMGWMPEAEMQVVGFSPTIKAAETAGLKSGDVLVSADGQQIRSRSRLQEVLETGNGKPVDLTYSRNGKTDKITITPERGESDGKERWMIGILFEQRVEIVKLPFPQALSEATRQNVQSAKLIFKFLEGIVERRMSPKSLEGPIRIAQMSGDAARQGADRFIYLMSAVSLNLAIFNLLPIPILDGGVILLLFVEMLLRRDLDLKVKEAVVKVGFVFLMVMVVFVIYNDISKILPPG